MLIPNEMTPELQDALRELFNITSPTVIEVLYRHDYHYEAAALSRVSRAYEELLATFKRPVNPDLQPELPIRAVA